MSEEETFKTGTGNIFRDFGFSAEEATALTIKASLFRTLQKALKEAPGTQTEVAARIGAPQPKVSDILNGRMAGFSLERLVNYLLRLDYEICFDAHPAPVGATGRVIDRSELATA